MNQFAYVNGAFVLEAYANVSIFDRGFLFGDGVYEVTPVIDGRLVDRTSHLERLARSLRELQIEPPVSMDTIDSIQQQLVELNRIDEGRVYMQITRGPAERDFAFPKHPKPSFIMFGRQCAVLDTPAARNGIRVTTVEDHRWARRDIKTVMLLPASLALEQARARGFDDAWLMSNGYITEGTSNNAFIVRDRTIYTRSLSSSILAGCTRRAVLRLAREVGLTVVERPFTPAMAYSADEAFVTSASALVTPVVQIDDSVLGDGKPGALTRRLRRIYIDTLKHENQSAAPLVA